MLLDPIFEKFAQSKAFTVMTVGAFERLLAPERLEQFIYDNADASDEGELLFSQLVDVAAMVVVLPDASLRSSVRCLSEVLTASDEADYYWLPGVESDVCRALVQDSFEQAQSTLQKLGVSRKLSLGKYNVKVIDGNAIKKTERRAKELGTYWDLPVQGRTIVVWDETMGLVSDVVGGECDHAQEQSLLPQVLKTVEHGQLWIGDQNFCALQFLFAVVSKGAFFAIRQHGTLKPKVLKPPVEADRTANGESVFEELVELELEGQPITVRRLTVTISQPMRNSDKEIQILTNVDDIDATAVQVAELYLNRWTSDAVFHEMTILAKSKLETFVDPKAALFVFSAAALIDDVLAILKGAIEAVHGSETASQISGHALGTELRRAHRGTRVAIDEPQWRVFREMPIAEFVGVLRKLAANIPLKSYQKTKRGPKKPQPEKT
ncbi:MAG: transposase [Planctomycetota bacterium]